MRFMRPNDAVIEPGMGQMDGEFTHYVNEVLLRRFNVAAGMLSGYRYKRDYRWDPNGKRWVHKDLPLDVEA